ncbi:hypothetical protein HYR54_06900 [Candidatus Acetothermia bacterium]|nr:hypothetical protein [Candidatus Acetothermia bacterium]MBI3459487.1 hypothetical protein [Candidatus Acetothermia bacterium]MBI3660619.1 hypothetical protein [Candidatus Acetothermia bacterium]
MEFYLADCLYDPEEELFITIYVTRDGSKVLKVRRLSSTVQQGLPLQLPDNWKYPEGVREISNSALRFYYRQKAEATQHRLAQGERMARVQPTL